MNGTEFDPEEHNDELRRRRDETLEQAVQILHDEFESVVVFVSDHNGGKLGTYGAWATRGNTYAADGMAREYLRRPNSPGGDE